MAPAQMLQMISQATMAKVATVTPPKAQAQAVPIIPAKAPPTAAPKTPPKTPTTQPTASSSTMGAKPCQAMPPKGDDKVETQGCLAGKEPIANFCNSMCWLSCSCAFN
jgi:hypothetical protein